MRIFWLFLPVVLALSQEKPVALYTGTGVWKHSIQTKSPEAQKYFDQGLSLMYGFNRYEALRSFRKAAELDPEAPMAQWGIAMATGPYINMDGDPTYDMKTSCGAVERGIKLNIRSDRERSYLQAAATRCPEYKDPEAYVSAMRGLAERWPDDLDAVTLYAESLMLPTRWHWYSNDGTRRQGTARSRTSAGDGSAPLARPSRRESPLHPRRGVFAHSGTRDSQRTAAHGNHAGRRPHDAHARPHLAGDGRLGNGGRW